MAAITIRLVFINTFHFCQKVAPHSGHDIPTGPQASLLCGGDKCASGLSADVLQAPPIHTPKRLPTTFPVQGYAIRPALSSVFVGIGYPFRAGVCQTNPYRRHNRYRQKNRYAQPSRRHLFAERLTLNVMAFEGGRAVRETTLLRKPLL